jgi:hypothetical protein
MVVAQVKGASGERGGNEASSAGASSRKSLISGLFTAIHFGIYHLDAK